MRNTIMTEKIARRGVRVPAEYEADFLDQVLVREVCSKGIVSLSPEQTLGEVRDWIASGAAGSSHQGFPVTEATGLLVGIVTRRTLLDPAEPRDRRVQELITRPPVIAYADSTLREAADHMVNHNIGRLPVVERHDRRHVIGILTRSDVLSAHRRRLQDTHESGRMIQLRPLRGRNGANGSA